MRVVKLVTVVGVTVCALGAGSAALAASSTPQGGKIRVFVTTAASNKEKIVVTGAIGDYGTTVSQDANGKVDPNGTFEKVTLKHGSFIINDTALTKKLDSEKPTSVNISNCSIVFVGSGPTTIGNGTGAYAGITGTLRLTYTFAGIAPKTAQRCNFSNNMPDGGTYISVTGTGNVSFH
jgi:hypothetical protein